MRAPEESAGEGTSRSEILLLDVRFAAPFSFFGQEFRFDSHWRQQWALNRLTSPDKFSIGNHYTVRGYDGNFMLVGDHGFSSRNEISWLIGETGHEIYGAFDVGRVWGPLTGSLPRKTLSGAAFGVRGKAWKFGYDLYVGRPLSHSDELSDRDWTIGFRAGVTF